MRRRVPLLHLATGALCSALLLGLLFVPALAPWLTRFEHWTADWRTAVLSPRAEAPHPQIAIVAITDETLKDLPSSPVDRGLLARVIAAVDAAQPKAIGLDVFFLKKTDDAKDEALASALKSATSPVILGAIDERGELEPARWEFQSAFLARTGRTAGYLNLRTESDGIVRFAARSNPGSKYPKSFVALLAETAGTTVTDRGAPVSWTLPAAPDKPVFPTFEALDLLGDEWAEKAEALKGKIVLIGGDFPLPPRDRHRIPLSVRDGAMVSGVSIHAHMLAGLMDPARAVTELPASATQLLLAAVGLGGILLGWALWRSNWVTYLRWTIATVALLAIDALCFTQLKLLLPFTLALVAWFAGMTAGHAFRSISRNWGRPSPVE